ncbi:glycosyltransferase family 2 protein [Dysgonomonas reticulitermitis]
MKLSIITINYNNLSGLKRTVESIIPHHRGDMEYLVIDGGSTDGSADIIKKNGDKINYWVSEPDSGIYNAMNKGIRQAKGEYILFINSGDTIRPNANIKFITSQLTGEDIIFFDLEIADPIAGNNYIKKYPDQPDFKYFVEDTLPHPGSFIRKELLESYGFYSENFKIVADWAFFMDAICIGKSTYKHIDSHFSTFYLDGISSDDKNRQLLFDERNTHIQKTYPIFYSFYKEWSDTKTELYKLKASVSIRYLKKLGFLKWLKL